MICHPSSIAWTIGLLVFAIPGVIPSLAVYRESISSYLLSIFVVIFYSAYSIAYGLQARRSNGAHASSEGHPQQVQPSQQQVEPHNIHNAEHKDQQQQEEGVLMTVQDAAIISAQDDDDEEQQQQQQLSAAVDENHGVAQEATPPTTATTTHTKKRVYFLDNVKTFLTVIVIAHHITIGFGGLGDWFIQVGADTPFALYTGLFFVLQNQNYFMPLFFFISAYFAPKSYARKGRLLFLKDRAQRIGFGAIGVLLVIGPCGAILANVTTGQPLGYSPVPGTAWFLWWLLLFNAIYATTQNNDSNNTTNNNNNNNNNNTLPPLLPGSKYLQKIPRLFYRWLFGALVFGLLQFALVTYVFHGPNSFAMMPMPIMGSIVCDSVLFYVGLVAGQNQWFSHDTTIRQQLGMNVWLFRLLVAVEYVFLGLSPLLSDFSDTTLPPPAYWTLRVGFILVNGMFCIDMSLAVLEFFQTFADGHNDVTRWWADNAYRAYLLQNFTIVLPTCIFVWSYTGEVVFEGNNQSTTPIPLGTHVTWWIYSLIVWTLATWVLAWLCKRLVPGLKYVL